MNVWRKAITGVAVLGLMGVTAGIAGATQPADGVRAAVQDLVSRGFPGAVAYIRDGDRVRYATAGVANKATDEPAQVWQRFRIASNTKSFVSTVLLQLVGEGRLSLVDSVERWLPGTVRGQGYDASKITVRQLLDHTSGIHDPENPHFFDPYLVDGDRGYVYTPAEVIRQSLADPPSFAPGAGVEYSNTGYLLLGQILEKVTGHDVTAEIRDRILRPLGLSHTSFPITDPYLHGPHLHGYDLKGEDMTTFSPSYDWTAGAMVSTVDDVAKFQQALLSGKLLKPAQQTELLKIVQGDGPVGYGLGIETFDLACPGGTRTLYGNTGAGPGYYSVSMTSADGNRQLVMALTSYDLAADQAHTQPWPAVPLSPMTAAFC
jgi:D-alanyl-D-alanine carboxypeptidase